MTDKQLREFGERVSEILGSCLVSPNENDRNFEPANIVDGLFAIARSIDRLTSAIRQTEPEK